MYPKVLETTFGTVAAALPTTRTGVPAALFASVKISFPQILVAAITAVSFKDAADGGLVICGR
jgi:hypothetical protein